MSSECQCRIIIEYVAEAETVRQRERERGRVRERDVTSEPSDSSDSQHDRVTRVIRSSQKKAD